MTNLRIEQDSNIEIVTALILKKLYDVASSNSIQSCVLKGNLQATHCWQHVYDYLTGNISGDTKRFPDLALNITDEKYITFADPAIEYVLIHGNDAERPGISADGIGVTYSEALSLGHIGTKTIGASLTKHLSFNENTDIVSFNELNLFGPIRLESGSFENCSNLESINLSNATYLGARCFARCSKLNIKINTPNLTGSGGGCFFNTRITEVENLGTITLLTAASGLGFFAGCENLTKVTLPETCTTLGGSCFGNCINLIDISPLNYITKLDTQSLATKSTFTKIFSFPNVTQCSTAFYNLGNNNTTIKQVYLPKLIGQTDINGYSQPGASWYHAGLFHNLITDLLYLRDILNFCGTVFAFCNINSLVIDNVTPPTLLNHKGMTDLEWTTYLSNNSGHYGAKTDLFYRATISNIYVPDAAVNTYKTTAVWSDKADIIKPISELTKVSTEADLQEGLIALIEAYTIDPVQSEPSE